MYVRSIPPRNPSSTIRGMYVATARSDAGRFPPVKAMSVWYPISVATTGSFAFFFALGYGATLLRPVFANPLAWRILESLIALVMWAIALKLLLGS